MYTLWNTIQPLKRKKKGNPIIYDNKDKPGDILQARNKKDTTAEFHCYTES